MIKLDKLTMHSDDIGSVVGDFHGTPIREFFPESVTLREESYSLAITKASMKARSDSGSIHVG